VLTRYQPDAFLELHLLKVYQQLAAANELQHYGPNFSLLSGFFASLQDPAIVLYDTRADGSIWYLAWLDLGAVGINYSVWIAPDDRHTKHALAAVLDTLSAAFTLGRVVVVHTRRTQLVRLYKTLGFVRCGTMPALTDGDETHIWSLTSQALDRTRARFHGVLAHTAQEAA